MELESSKGVTHMMKITFSKSTFVFPRKILYSWLASTDLNYRNYAPCVYSILGVREGVREEGGVYCYYCKKLNKTNKHGVYYLLSTLLRNLRSTRFS